MWVHQAMIPVEYQKFVDGRKWFELIALGLCGEKGVSQSPPFF